MEQTELTDDEREMLAWIESWKVDPVVSDEDTMDLVVIATRPPWLSEDAGETGLDNPDEMRAYYATGLSPFVWEALPVSTREQTYSMMRYRAWCDVIVPLMERESGS